MGTHRPNDVSDIIIDLTPDPAAVPTLSLRLFILASSFSSWPANESIKIRNIPWKNGPLCSLPVLAVYGTYDLYSPICNTFDAGKSITRASGRGLSPGNRDFFGPCEMASSRYAHAVWGSKKSRFPGPNPLPLAQVVDLPTPKALHTGLYQSKAHR